MSDSPIGLIGVGLLGSALAERMLAGGWQVSGYDVAEPANHQLEAIGGKALNSAGAVFRQCEFVVLCLPTSNIVRSVLAECDAELRSGQLLIDATTGDPTDTANLAEAMAARGIGYVAATIAGSSQQVRRGEAVVLVGANEDDTRRAQPVLMTWGDKRFAVDSPADSARLKLIVNLVLGLHRAVLAEGLALAAACGFDLRLTLQLLGATPAYSRVMETKGEKMVTQDYQPQARLAQHLKDVRLIRELAARVGALTPLSDTHEGLLLKACELGFANADNAAIMEAFRHGWSS